MECALLLGFSFIHVSNIAFFDANAPPNSPRPTAPAPAPGFDKFYPRKGSAPGRAGVNAKQGQKASAGKASGGGGVGGKGSSSSSSSSFKSKFGQGKGGGGGGGKNNPNPNFPNPGEGGMTQLASLIGLTALVSLVFGGGSNNGREINWVDFRNTLMASGEVDKVIVTNKNVAKVIMKPGEKATRAVISMLTKKASGLQSWNTSPMGGPTGKVGGGSFVPDYPSSKRSKGDADAFGDSTVIELSGSPGEKSASPSPFSSASNVNMNTSAVFHFTIGSVDSFERKLEESQREMGVHPKDFVPVQYTSETSWSQELLKMAPTALLIGAYLLITRNLAGGGGGGGMSNVFKIGKSNAKKIKKEDINVTFKDVAGCNEAKKEIMEFVDFLQDGSRFRKLGAKIPKGALLCGPPGTGKTLLAKAVAGEASVPFFSISGSDFIEMFVGVGPSRVRDLFKEARSNAPCIVFIDEIDAVGRQRGKGGFSGGNDERENTLNQLLVEMDGFTEATGVVVLAGTNRADILDNALTRPGRFDRQITVDKPDIKGRKEIFLVHLKGIKINGEPEDYAGRLAGLTPGMAGADIANMCNEAAIVAARRKAESVDMVDFEEATDRVVGGLTSNKLVTDKEKEIVAHHEAGHAVAGWFLEHADPLMKVTIVPRSSGALGFAQYLPKEVFLRSRDEINDIICMALAGRAAEQIIFGRVTTGASDDLRRVTGMVYQMIQVYGMNENIGQLSFPKDESNPYADRPYSDKTAEAMDVQAKEMVDAAYDRTLTLLKSKKEELVKVAELLMQRETINHDDVVDLIGPRPFTGDKVYEEFVANKRHGITNDVPASENVGETADVLNPNDADTEVQPGPLGLAIKKV